jgi:hypothetical protein
MTPSRSPPCGVSGERHYGIVFSDASSTICFYIYRDISSPGIFQSWTDELGGEPTEATPPSLDLAPTAHLPVRIVSNGGPSEGAIDYARATGQRRQGILRIALKSAHWKPPRRIRASPDSAFGVTGKIAEEEFFSPITTSELTDPLRRRIDPVLEIRAPRAM